MTLNLKFIKDHELSRLIFQQMLQITEGLYLQKYTSLKTKWMYLIFYFNFNFILNLNFFLFRFGSSQPLKPIMAMQSTIKHFEMN